MIFVTLGTQDKSFERLLKIIDEQAEKGNINDQIIVQAGYTKYKSANMEIFDYIDMNTFNRYIDESDIVITHGGVGSILTSIMKHKKVIAVARLSDFDEHENDHQIEIVTRFRELGYILGCIEVGEFAEKWQEVNDFKPVEYKSNNDKFCELIKMKIG